jgi:hypothetical protein
MRGGRAQDEEEKEEGGDVQPAEHAYTEAGQASRNHSPTYASPTGRAATSQGRRLSPGEDRRLGRGQALADAEADEAQRQTVSPSQTQYLHQTRDLHALSRTGSGQLGYAVEPLYTTAQGFDARRFLRTGGGVGRRIPHLMEESGLHTVDGEAYIPPQWLQEPPHATRPQLIEERREETRAVTEAVLDATISDFKWGKGTGLHIQPFPAPFGDGSNFDATLEDRQGAGGDLESHRLVALDHGLTRRSQLQTLRHQVQLVPHGRTGQDLGVAEELSSTLRQSVRALDETAAAPAAGAGVTTADSVPVLTFNAPRPASEALLPDDAAGRTPLKTPFASTAAASTRFMAPAHSAALLQQAHAMVDAEAVEAVARETAAAAQMVQRVQTSAAAIGALASTASILDEATVAAGADPNGRTAVYSLATSGVGIDTALPLGGWTQTVPQMALGSTRQPGTIRFAPTTTIGYPKDSLGYEEAADAYGTTEGAMSPTRVALKDHKYIAHVNQTSRLPYAVHAVSQFDIATVAVNEEPAVLPYDAVKPTSTRVEPSLEHTMSLQWQVNGIPKPGTEGRLELSLRPGDLRQQRQQEAVTSVLARGTNVFAADALAHSQGRVRKRPAATRTDLIQGVARTRRLESNLVQREEKDGYHKLGRGPRFHALGRTIGALEASASDYADQNEGAEGAATAADGAPNNTLVSADSAMRRSGDLTQGPLVAPPKPWWELSRAAQAAWQEKRELSYNKTWEQQYPFPLSDPIAGLSTREGRRTFDGTVTTVKGGQFGKSIIDDSHDSLRARFTTLESALEKKARPRVIAESPNKIDPFKILQADIAAGKRPFSSPAAGTVTEGSMNLTGSQRFPISRGFTDSLTKHTKSAFDVENVDNIDAFGKEIITSAKDLAPMYSSFARDKVFREDKIKANRVMQEKLLHDSLFRPVTASGQHVQSYASGSMLRIGQSYDHSRNIQESQFHGTMPGEGMGGVDTFGATGLMLGPDGEELLDPLAQRAVDLQTVQLSSSSLLPRPLNLVHMGSPVTSVRTRMAMQTAYRQRRKANHDLGWGVHAQEDSNVVDELTGLLTRSAVPARSRATTTRSVAKVLNQVQAATAKELATTSLANASIYYTQSLLSSNMFASAAIEEHNSLASSLNHYPVLPVLASKRGCLPLYGEPVPLPKDADAEAEEQGKPPGSAFPASLAPSPTATATWKKVSSSFVGNRGILSSPIRTTGLSKTNFNESVVL